MLDLKELKALIQKEILLDLKSKNIVLSTFLYIFSTVFICYLSFGGLELDIWNGLMWIILLFAVTNASNKIFLNERQTQKIYIYSLAGPRSVIMAKIIYQWIFTGIIALLVLFSWKLVYNINLKHWISFLAVLLLGIWAMSNVLTLNNALAVETSNSPAVLAILSFPVLLPIILTTIKASKLTLMQNINPELYQLGLVLVLLNLLTAIMSYLLFPYLWRY